MIGPSIRDQQLFQNRSLKSKAFKLGSILLYIRPKPTSEMYNSRTRADDDSEMKSGLATGCQIHFDRRTLGIPM